MKNFWLPILCVTAISGCAAMSGDSGLDDYNQQAQLPEIKAYLIENNYPGNPYMPVYKNIQSYAASGGAREAELIRLVYGKYPLVRGMIDPMFSPEWLLERFSYGYQYEDGGRELKRDLAVYKVVSSSEDYKKAEALTVKALELNQKGSFDMRDLMAEPVATSESYLAIGEQRLVATVAHPKLYKLKSSPLVGVNLPGLLYYLEANGGKDYGTGDYFRVGDKAEKLKFSVIGRSVTYKQDNIPMYSISGPGEFKLQISLAGQTLELPIEVVELPFRKGDSVDAVIESLGLPDEEKTYTASWPCAETANGFRYEPSASQGTILVVHWAYDKYPALVLEIGAYSSTVKYVGSKSKVSLDEFGRESCG